MRRFAKEWLREARSTFGEMSPSEAIAKAWLGLLFVSVFLIFFAIFGMLVYLSVLATSVFWGIWLVWVGMAITLWALGKTK